jgi:uncharacterized membrane protein
MTASAAPRARIESVDVVRGVIMIIMALDHTRDFFGIPGQNPIDLSTASAGLFLTRWITYFCAPVFFLLTGTGAYLALRRRTVADLSMFLITRSWCCAASATSSISTTMSQCSSCSGRSAGR